MIKNIPNGVYPTMVTPFTADNKIDYNGVLQIIDWYDKNGVAGILEIGQSSEIFFLSSDIIMVKIDNPIEINIIFNGSGATLIPARSLIF